MNNPFEVIDARLENIEKMQQGILLAFKGGPAPEFPHPNIILNGDQLSTKLGVSVQTLILWRKKGKIPFFQIGTSIRYDLHKVLAAIEKKGASK